MDKGRRLTLRTAITIPEDVLVRELDGEAVLLNLKTGIYFGLNAEALRIWQLLAEKGSLEEILEAMCREYDADARVLERDLLDLCQQLCDRGLGVVISS